MLPATLFSLLKRAKIRWLPSIFSNEYQDTAPTRTQLLNEVSYDPATEVAPDYRTWGEPGCWFMADGKLNDLQGNCADLAPLVPALEPLIPPDQPEAP